MALEKREVDRYLVIPLNDGVPGTPYWEVHTVVEEVEGETRKQIGGVVTENVPTTLEAAQAYIGAENAALAAANAQLNAQNTALQAQVADLTQRLTDAVSALDRTRSADRAYEAQVGPTIDAVLVKEWSR